MNLFEIVGTIQRVNIQEKNAFITILAKDGPNDAEFISVTSFQPDFCRKYLDEKNKPIAVRGHIHINKHNEEYTTELIADKFYFIGAKNQNGTTNAAADDADATAINEDCFSQTDKKLPWEI